MTTTPAARRIAKDALFEGFAAIGKALASGRRIEILDLLAQGERSVDEVASELKQSVANTSHHIRALAAAGLVRTRRQGTRIFYRLAGEAVEELWSAVQRVGTEHLAGIEQLVDDYLGERGSVEEVGRTELVRRLRRGEVTLVDVRPRPEFEAGHITGARSVPLEELPRFLRTLPKDADVVAYCRGPFCVYADEAVRRLVGKGVRARRLVDGFPEWRRDGLPVEIGKEAG
jgi:rhodanese-related sulfurtransferase